MIASLPMYDRPANRAAHDRLWALIRDGLRGRGLAAPHSLSRDLPYRQTWARPDLVLGQICNLPYRLEYRDSLTLIGAADYGLGGCRPGYYRSVIVARRDDPRDLPALLRARFAANALDSHSGFAAILTHVMSRRLPLPAPMITGSHDASVLAIANGSADLAAIDQQTWVMQQADMPAAQALRILEATTASPGQSFVTTAGQDPAPYFAAISAAIRALRPEDRAVLGLRGLVALPDTAYDLPAPVVYA